nr:hypothetical protein [Pontibacter harenae]
MPTYLFAFILFYLPTYVVSLPPTNRWMMLGLIVFSTFVIPGLGAYAMMRAGQIDSLEMNRREQRRMPLFFTCLCYSVTTYLLHREPVFDAIFYFVMGTIAASVFFAFLVSLFWKVSAHSIGVGGSLGLLLVLNMIIPEALLLIPIMLMITIAGAVLSARLALQAHTPAQVYSGFGGGLLLAGVVAVFM